MSQWSWPPLYFSHGTLGPSDARARSPHTPSHRTRHLRPRSRPIELALAHYALNIAWAPIFFGLKYFKTALVVQVLLVASLVEIMRQFLAVSGVLSAALLAPYLVWLVFATALNFELCRLNPNPRASIAGSPAS